MKPLSSLPVRLSLVPGLLALSALATVSPTAIGADKVVVCHVNNGEYEHVSIEVSASSLDTHLNQHGDHLPYDVYADTDGDGYGDPDSVQSGVCETPSGYVEDDSDCDDANADVNPGVADDSTNDGIDDDCDGETDEDYVGVECPCFSVDDILADYTTDWDSLFTLTEFTGYTSEVCRFSDTISVLSFGYLYSYSGHDPVTRVFITTATTANANYYTSDLNGGWCVGTATWSESSTDGSRHSGQLRTAYGPVTSDERVACEDALAEAADLLGITCTY